MISVMMTMYKTFYHLETEGIITPGIDHQEEYRWKYSGGNALGLEITLENGIITYAVAGKTIPHCHYLKTNNIHITKVLPITGHKEKDELIGIILKEFKINNKSKTHQLTRDQISFW